MTMEIKSYRAGSVQEALALVRADLGPDAAVLHTREVTAGGRWFGGPRQIEVVATPEADRVPSRLSGAPVEPLAAPPAPRVERGGRYRSRLAAAAAQGVDLLDAAPAASSEAALEAWPGEVAAHFLRMLTSLSPEDRRRVVGAIAEQARGRST